MTDAAWEPAPEGHVLVPGECRARDGDGQGCTRGVIHPMSDHQHTGLRTWLESTEERAIIRVYDIARADELEAMEGAPPGAVPVRPGRPAGPRPHDGRRAEQRLGDARGVVRARAEGDVPRAGRLLCAARMARLACGQVRAALTLASADC